MLRDIAHVKMPLCTTCGQEVSFIPQYQQWYCPYCRTYPYLQQAVSPPYYQAPAYPGYYQQPPYYQQYYAPPVMFQQPPAVGPSPQNARSKIYSSFMMRQSTDQVIPTFWAWIILVFQIILPLSAIIAIYAFIVDTGFDITDTGPLMLIILAILLVSIGLAITHAVLTYKLVKRRDEHFKRDRILNDGMAEYLGAVALNTSVDLNVERWTLNTIMYAGNTQERSASLWAMLVALLPIIPFIGVIFLIYCQVFLTKDMQEHDEKQRNFNYQYQVGLAKAGKLGNDSFFWQPLPKRDVAAYVVLTILTLGLFLPYWWYVNIVDMNTHIANQWNFENALVKKLQADG
ncbi:MAG: hypothetical protein R6W91_02980 [Thermoplasmata archaeon]